MPIVCEHCGAESDVVRFRRDAPWRLEVVALVVLFCAAGGLAVWNAFQHSEALAPAVEGTRELYERTATATGDPGARDAARVVYNLVDFLQSFFSVVFVYGLFRILVVWASLKEGDPAALRTIRLFAWGQIAFVLVPRFVADQVFSGVEGVRIEFHPTLVFGLSAAVLVLAYRPAAKAHFNEYRLEPMPSEAEPDADEPGLDALVEQLAAVVRAVVPQAVEDTTRTHPAFLVDGVAFCRIRRCADHIRLVFPRGADLRDPKGLLQGRGKWARHVRIEPGDAVREDALGPLLRRAAALTRRKQTPAPT